MSNKKDKIISNIKAEIGKIDSKKNRIYFFVIDTKGAPSGSLEYIYNLALILKEDGYDVSMLHTEDEFVGVESWLGKKYADLPHYNVNKGDVGTSPSDILFIPEIFSQVMNQTKNLPCKRPYYRTMTMLLNRCHIQLNGAISVYWRESPTQTAKQRN